ncbi:hypothetical protein PHYBOEH_010879 [Phytophthora boehmeriae]|uniref:RxLR effector protein n=1 Tax=Phytophthora boehmeriae TaxID=109152 RepID=A0A8T1VN01_9STRA|nr:hypothetical protein PHYBOEH_010879 [Phytophthora boehmeriae]
MRVSYVLLMTMATFFAGNDFVSASATGPTKVAAATSTDDVESIDSALFNDYTKRSLRIHESEKKVIDEEDDSADEEEDIGENDDGAEDEEDIDEDDDGTDEEERVKATKLLKYIERDDIAYAKFGKWATRKKPFTPTDFYNKYVMTNEKWRPIYNKYHNWYKTAGY